MRVFENGAYRDATEKEEAEIYEAMEHPLSTEEQIAYLKSELSTYDYIGVKIAMGVATVEEYAEEIAYTETLREKIRQLSGE